MDYDNKKFDTTKTYRDKFIEIKTNHVKVNETVISNISKVRLIISLCQN